MQISVVHAATMDDAVTAWRLSRDKGASYSASDIAKVDAPVMEMPSAILNFDDFTILEREIFCSLRNHVVWARTSRVDDPLQFTVPGQFKVKEHETYRHQMVARQQLGIPQDEWRFLLPLVAHTSWTQRISMRDLARMALYFGYLGGKAELHALGIRFTQIQYEIVKLMTEMLGSKITHDILINMRLAKFLHEGRLPNATDLTQFEYFKMIRCNVNVALRAQIIRHRELQFVDDLWQLINTTELPYLQLKHKVNIQLMARNDVWQAVLSKRACWIAQADLWQPIIKAFGWHPPLPCAEKNECPYDVDARARLDPGKDPNPPCPVFCNLYRIPKEPHMQAMMKEAKKRGDFWIAAAQR